MEKKYYKIVNPKGHNGLIYKEGLNVDTERFNTSPCCGGGLFFSDIKNIFEHVYYGTEIWEVEPIGEVIKVRNKFKAHALNMKRIGLWYNINIFKNLIKNGANIHARNESAIQVASKNGHLNIVKYLVENGANIHSDNEYALRMASVCGHLEVVRYLVENGADIHAKDNYAINMAFRYNHLEIVNYLREGHYQLSLTF